jgi:coproporphyrinogen III oxidase-like Fe-S oxidoreductase
MMRLRTADGISRAEYEKRFLLPFDPLEKALEKCRERGHAMKTGTGRWCLTAEGFLLSNGIISDLLLLQDRSEPLAKRR